MQQPSVPVLRSKIRIPALPEACIPRPALEDRALEHPEAPAERIVYLSAPPGYGKTTLLGRVAQRFAGVRVWVSLDPLDNDPERLAVHLTAALSAATGAGGPSGAAGEPGAGGEPGGAGEPEGSDFARVLYRIQLLEDPVLLVLDEAHTLQSEAVFAPLREFLSYRPENCRVAIATREDLPLPLSAHRQSERLLELREAELRANEPEARALLTSLGVELDDETLHGVMRKTAGWWSCLKLFAISWKQRPGDERLRFFERFRGTNRFVAEFLLESLVSALPPELSEIAGVMAVPDFFNERLYRYLTGRDDSRRFVERLQRMNVIGLRPEEGTARYRFHPLLRDYLRHQLPRTRRAELHRLAAEWFTENGLADRAARHAHLAARLDRETAQGPPGETPAAAATSAGTASGAASGAAVSGGPSAEPVAGTGPGDDAADAAPGGKVPDPGGEAADHAGAGAPTGAHPGVTFSRRERELLAALAEGLSNDEIAARLFISTGTVKWHLNNIYSKLGARSRTDAVRRAREVGLLGS